MAAGDQRCQNIREELGDQSFATGNIYIDSKKCLRAIRSEIAGENIREREENFAPRVPITAITFRAEVIHPSLRDTHTKENY